MKYSDINKKDTTYKEDEIIKGCLSNSRKWQEILYKKFFNDCYYMCLRYTKDTDTAKLIVNDGFLRIFKNIGKYSGTGSLKAWIKRIVFNSMSDYYRKENRYLKMMLFEEKEKIIKEDQNDQLYYDDIIRLVDELNLTTKNVFTLYAIDGYGHKEIGNMLGISEGNSKWHLHKARKILQEKIINQSKMRNHA